MRLSALLFAAATFAAGLTATASADDNILALSNPAGATVAFARTDGLWRWTNLKTPDGPTEGWPVTDDELEVAVSGRTESAPAAWRLVEALPEKLIFEQESAVSGLNLRRVFSFGPASNVLRIETQAQSTEGTKVLARITLLQAQIEGAAFRETGAAPVSFPLFADTLFAGVEHVNAEASVSGELADRVRLYQRPRVSVGEGWQTIAAAVVGWTEPGVGNGLTGEARLREAFLRYLDTVRVKPDRIVLHTDSWWTVPLPLTDKNLISNIDTLYRAFGERTGMFFDSYAVDLGWSEPKSLWKMDTNRLPSELRPVNERLAALGTRMGLWMSPGSGYPEALNNTWLQSQGYEVMPFEGLENAACMALGGRYQREFKERVVAYARQYELGHVILDFMPQRCDVAAHGHPVGPESRYAIDAGLADVLDSLRAVNPNIWLEPMVCGYPPSPWWLMKTPFVLGPAGDDLPYGRGPCPDWLESLITARDVAYRAGQESWLMPTQALETFDITVLSPGEFQNMAVMAIGRGRWFLSTYFKAELMKPEDWDFLAALVRWARANKQYLENAWQFGGHPENREAYGFMFRHPAKDLYCVRNPWMEPRAIDLPVSGTLRVPRDVRMIYPRRATIGRIQPGEAAPRIVLAPYETVFLETVPATENTVTPTEAGPALIGVTASAPRFLTPSGSAGGEGARGVRYYWDGVLSSAGIAGAELYVLVEGGPDIDRASCKLLLGGQEVKPRKVTSAGQFGAAIDASSENWTWFIVPLPSGDVGFQLDLTVPSENASLGVYVRGYTAAANDAAPEEGAVFPTFHADRRAWSQTLQPLRSLTPNEL